MQTKNLLVFAVLAAALIGAWYFFVAPPTREKKEEDKTKKFVELKPKSKPEEKKKPIEKEKPKPPEVKKKPPPEKAPVKEPPPTTKTLGGEEFFLTVDVTSRGAAVRKVTLNRFQAADWHGRPTDRLLELIQDDEFSPSYRMYHYLNPDDKRPVFGLGEKTWDWVPLDDHDPDGKKIVDDARAALKDGTIEVKDGKLVTKSAEGAIVEEKVYLRTRVPDFGGRLKIIKSYRLARQDYHVTLLLELHDTRDRKGDDKKEIQFRYQLTGAQGLPIEGEWYTSIFRNAFMALVDPSENVYRKLEDAAHVSAHKGGESWPISKLARKTNRLQYAGVANQFFGAMLVVDNVQPAKKDGGKSADDILAWARPTQETTEKKGIIASIAKDASHITFVNPNPLVRISRSLTDKDSLSKARKGCFMKTHDVRLYAGFTYDIEMVSRDFNCVFSVEDNDKNKLAEVADQDGKNASLVFRPPHDGEYRIVATTKDPGETGDYGLGVRERPQKYVLLPRTKRHFEDLDLEQEQEVTLSFYTTPEGTVVATWVRLGATPRQQFDDITVRVNSEVETFTPGDVVKHQFLLYHGPVKAALLGQFTGDKEVPPELVERYTHTLHLRTLTDYPNDNWLGWISSKIMLTDVIIFVTRFMHWLLDKLHYVFGYGLSILVLTVMVRGAMFPISRKQALFSIKMQELAPELKKLQDKYPDDPQAKMQAQQEFYRKHGINPLGSCWPVFLQMPIFLGLYFALQESIHFRLAEFLWIKNLAAPDMLLYWSESIPWVSNPDSLGTMFYLGPYLNILPMIAVVFMMVQQLQTMPPPTDEQQAMQQKMLKFMTIFFGFMFYKVAAGLCVYFIASSLWGMAERKLLPKKKTTTSSLAPSTSASTTAAAKAPAYKSKIKPTKKDKAPEVATTFDKIKALWREILKNAEKK